ncbi:MAG: coproporphyrinogen dehydrogenase HemZ [Clostridia bacterium]|nr:coproporphyrinogen dehydrogenase HemZ [Clostridia bacterium]
MIYLKLDGHNYIYEIEDIIKLFFSETKIERIDIKPPVEFRGIFMSSEISSGNNGTKVCTKVYIDGTLLGKAEGVIEAASMHLNEQQTKKRIKREIKRQVFVLLGDYTGRKPPWGILTGIRPAKIVHEMAAKGALQGEIIENLKSMYYVSAEKANILLDVAEAERDILRRNTRNLVSVYIGIPFCPSRCLYCSFTSSPILKNSHLLEGYMAALEREINETSKLLKENAYKIQSLYIGGGTPTALHEKELGRLLSWIEEHFDLDMIEEYTLEAGRPDSIDEGKLTSIKKSRVTRISINPQTMNDKTLKLIGRNHSARDIVEKFALARKIGFDNINMDLIVGLPEEGKEDFIRTLDQVRNLGPESLTVHTMAVKRASELKEKQDAFLPIPESEASDMIDFAFSYAKSMGMDPYYLYRQKNMVGNLENIGYAKKGFECIYNVQIMEEKQSIFALGAGGVTKVVYPVENRIERAFNVKSIEEYVNRVSEMMERKRALIPQ